VAERSNGDFLKWIANLVRILAYVSAIVYATLFVAKWDRRMEAVEQRAERIERKLDKLSDDTIQRSEYERVKRAANREHRRIWTAIGKKLDAEDLPE
jgi:hypothetical protein